MTATTGGASPGASEVTWLFVPGDRPERFAGAYACGADAVILDLEDAVTAHAKDGARLAVCEHLRSAAGWVRINAAGTPWHAADLQALAECRGLTGVIVPKAEDPEILTGIAQALGPERAVIALVESARGVVAAGALAAAPGVRRLAFGSVDFAVDINADHEDDALAHARGAVVLAARAAGSPAPIDGVTLRPRDVDLTRADAECSRSRGFGGKLCIHPLQVPAVRSAFAPSEQEVAWAANVLAAVDGSAAGPAHGALLVDGELIDAPVLARARRIAAGGSSAAEPPPLTPLQTLDRSRS